MEGASRAGQIPFHGLLKVSRWSNGQGTLWTRTVNLFFALARISSALRLSDAVEYVDSLSRFSGLETPRRVGSGTAVPSTYDDAMLSSSSP